MAGGYQACSLEPFRELLENGLQQPSGPTRLPFPREQRRQVHRGTQLPCPRCRPPARLERLQKPPLCLLIGTSARHFEEEIAFYSEQLWQENNISFRMDLPDCLVEAGKALSEPSMCRVTSSSPCRARYNSRNRPIGERHNRAVCVQRTADCVFCQSGENAPRVAES
jgi:hypothetical protein